MQERASGKRRAAAPALPEAQRAVDSVILGVDPSLRGTGFGVIETARPTHKTLAQGTIKCPASWEKSRCLAFIAQTLRARIKEFSPTACIIEGLFHAQNIKTALTMGEARGAALVAAAEAGLDIYEIAPRKMKLAIVGHGAAQKDAVARMVQRMLLLPELPAPDAADAPRPRPRPRAGERPKPPDLPQKSMITFVRGKLIEALPTRIVVDVNGVGYEALIPLSSFDQLPALGEDAHVLTHLAVREDAHTLYGFMTAGERELFRLLISAVSGIGPRIALNVLSGMSVESFSAAVAAGDDKALAQISGIGKKTAQRIVVELKDKVGKSHEASPAGAAGAAPASEQKLNDAAMALIALGFKQTEAGDSVKAAMAMLGESAAVEDLVRAALKK